MIEGRRSNDHRAYRTSRQKIAFIIAGSVRRYVAEALRFTKWGLVPRERDDAALLANSFTASVGTDGKGAANIIATLATALTG
jgi:hypothetical protein